MKILVTGGAGYVGSVLIGDLLNAGYSVTCFDRLDYGIKPISQYLEHPHFELIVDDIRRGYALQQAVMRSDAIIHLAAIVGYPLCDKHPDDATGINWYGSVMLNEARSKHQRVVYASTESVYGGIHDAKDGILREWMKVEPRTIYGKSKHDAEMPFLEKENAVIYRFATGYGLSPRMRHDTMVNDFTRQLTRVGSLSVYEPYVTRSFIHVRQMSHALIYGIGAPDGVYNCGAISMRKQKLVDTIVEQIGYGEVTYGAGSDLEMRDYYMNCDKLKETGFMLNELQMGGAIKTMARYFTHDTVS